MVLAILRSANEIDTPAMQLQLLVKRVTPGNGVVGEYGDPVILCDLSAAEAKHVLNDGVPATLVNAMVDCAKSHDWQPQRLPDSFFRRIIYVSPSGHFPQTAAQQ